MEPDGCGGREAGTPAAFGEAETWVARHCLLLAGEPVETALAVGRVLAEAVVADTDLPPFDRAAWDGYALRAELTAGASAYNPLPVAATRVAAGDRLPDTVDAVVPVEAVTVAGALLELAEPVAAGSGIERAGAELRRGEVAVDAGRVVRAHDVGLLATLGVEAVSVVRRPQVGMLAVSAGPKGRDADTPMLEALVERDGGVAETASRVADLPQALAVPGADLVLVCGGTGLGESDVAASALAQTGRLELLGVAIRPGETACLGAVGAVPVFLLPGLPVACYAAYELLAGPSVRRMGGRNADWPYGRAELPLRRKLVSEIGVADLQRVRVVDGGIEPVGAGTAFGLASVVRADGFVVVSPGSEGYPAGTRVEVRLYEPLVTA